MGQALPNESFVSSTALSLLFLTGHCVKTQASSAKWLYHPTIHTPEKTHLASLVNFTSRHRMLSSIFLFFLRIFSSLADHFLRNLCFYRHLRRDLFGLFTICVSEELCNPASPYWAECTMCVSAWFWPPAESKVAGPGNFFNTLCLLIISKPLLRNFYLTPTKDLKGNVLLLLSF
jgi:hypothetical protein